MQKYYCVEVDNEAGEIQTLIRQYGYVEREVTAERGEVNKVDTISYEHFAALCHNMDAFDIGGKSIIIDTSNFDKVDFEDYIHVVKEFLREEGKNI